MESREFLGHDMADVSRGEGFETRLGKNLVGNRRSLKLAVAESRQVHLKGYDLHAKIASSSLLSGTQQTMQLYCGISRL